TLHYRVEPRDAKTWNSGPLSLGDPRVKNINLIDLVIWNRGQITWELWTDLPGNVMTMRTTGVFNAVTDRTPVTLALDPGFDGRQDAGSHGAELLGHSLSRRVQRGRRHVRLAEALRDDVEDQTHRAVLAGGRVLADRRHRRRYLNVGRQSAVVPAGVCGVLDI